MAQRMEEDIGDKEEERTLRRLKGKEGGDYYPHSEAGEIDW